MLVYFLFCLHVTVSFTCYCIVVTNFDYDLVGCKVCSPVDSCQCFKGTNCKEARDV
jgi:hypothetical protein